MSKRSGLLNSLFFLIFGLLALTTAMRSPGFAQIRPVDLVRLLAAGVLFGLALGFFVVWLRRGTFPPRD